MAKGPSAPFSVHSLRNAPRLEARETPQSPHDPRSWPRCHAALLPRRLRRGTARHRAPATSPRSSPRRPTTSASRTAATRTRSRGPSYLEWTDAWIEAAARVLAPEGSLFLNVGAKPSDPWTALDVAQAARPHLQLQNIIHWIKSIAIDRETDRRRRRPRPRPGGRPLQADQQRALRERLPRVRLPLHAGRPHAASTASRSACPTRTSRTSPAGAPAAATRCRGNTWFIPYETIQRRDRTGRIRRRSRPGSPSSACALHGLVAHADW